MKRCKLVIAIFVAGMAVGCADAGRLQLSCNPTVPREFQQQPPELDPPPNGQPERVRYTQSYEAFWWNCVALKADDLSARCPFLCNGTSAAVLGCADGAGVADQAVSALLKQHPASDVTKYLKSIAAEPVAKEKMEPYLRGRPQAERVRE